jgi:hypothetical protein
MRSSSGKELPYSLPEGTPYVKKLSLSAVVPSTGYATRNVVIGAVTYTEATDFKAGGLDITNNDYALLIADAINGYLIDKDIGNSDAYARSSGDSVFFIGRVPGKNFTFTTNITGASTSTIETGLERSTSSAAIFYVSDTVLTISTGAYAIGDNIGGKLTLSTVMPDSDGKTVLQDIFIRDYDNEKAPLNIAIFESNPTAATLTDNAAQTLSTDRAKVIHRVQVFAADYVTIKDSGDDQAYATIENIGKVLLGADGTKHLYAAINVTGTPTYGATTDLEIVFSFTNS